MSALKFLLFGSVIAAPAAQGASRDSTAYRIALDIVDSGGGRTASTSYTNDGSVGGVVGVSSVASPAATAKQGFIGQLYDVTGLTLTAASLTMNEGGTNQLGAWQALDDATFLAVPATSVTWNVQSGPLTSISAGGVATAALVYLNTPATAEGSYLGNTGVLGLTVANVSQDNFGAYAGDTLDDAWQVQYFGQPPNTNAGPLVDFDNDGQTNAFEYTAGLIPTDGNSVFRLRLEAVPGQPGQKRVIFSPRLTDRTYTVKGKPSLLTGPFTALGSSSFTDNAQERTVIDLNASGAAKFYQVEIAKP